MIDWSRQHEGRVNGVLEFSIERRKKHVYLRRWIIRSDGTSVPGSMEQVKSIREAKAYASALTGNSRGTPEETK